MNEQDIHLHSSSELIENYNDVLIYKDNLTKSDTRIILKTIYQIRIDNGGRKYKKSRKFSKKHWINFIIKDAILNVQELKNKSQKNTDNTDKSDKTIKQ